MRKTNKKLWNHLLQELKDFDIQAGWFENTRYDSDTPVAYIAAIQNYGATAKNPGGQPYYINSSTGLAVFVSKNSLFGKHLIERGQVTKEHEIVIPARPFMDNAKRRVQTEGKQILLLELSKVFNGKQTMQQAITRLGLWLQRVIQEEIRAIEIPQLKRCTVRNREKRYTTKRKGNPKTISKPLIDTGLMFDTVQYRAETK